MYQFPTKLFNKCFKKFFDKVNDTYKEVKNVTKFH